MRANRRIGRRFVVAVGGAVLVASSASPANAAAKLTPATGGENISVLSTFVTLTGPVVAESASGEVGVGTIVLLAPTGFAFDPARSVTARVTDSGSCPASRTLRLGTSQRQTSQTVTPTSTSITVNVYQRSRGSCRGTITWSGIRVKAEYAARGDIFERGTSYISGLYDALSWGKLSTTSSPSAPPCSGPIPFSASGLVQIDGPLDGLEDVAIDAASRYAYVTNSYLNRVEVLDLVNRVRLCPIPVGQEPTGLDLTADGTKLYVANALGHSVSVVDTATRKELRRIAFPGATEGLSPYSIAIAKNGKAFVTMADDPDYPQWVPVYELNIATGGIRQRTDVGSVYWGYVEASPDRSFVGLVSHGISDGPFFVYSASTDSFGRERSTHATLSQMDFDKANNKILMAPSTYIMSPNLNQLGAVAGGGYRGAAISSTGATGYRVVEQGVEIMDLERYLVVGNMSLADSVNYAGYGGIGRTELTPDDRYLVTITDNGVSVRAVPSPAPRAPVCQKPSSTVGTNGFVPLAFDPEDIVVDREKRYVYMTNRNLNQVEVLNLGTGAFECPVPVASAPYGLDLTADGTKLYVATAGSNSVSVIDLATRGEAQRIRIPWRWENDNPFQIAVSRNKAILSTTFSGYGWGGRVLAITLSTGGVQSFYTATEATYMEASGDRSRVAVAIADQTSGTTKLTVYNSGTSSFGT
ncbi:MAG TPA: hypothetical protein VHI54_09395, partial [Actinomycetota bacterium]|nr:hypothetical protein [Actinomycetota bacterium]